MLLVIVSLSCNDPTLVGSSLVTDDVINAKKKSDFEIDVFQHEPDSQLYYVPLTSDQPSRKVQIGIIKDEDNNLFGENIASFFLQLIPLQNAANIENAVLDSAVLELYYDTTADYGPDIFPHSISVHEVSEDISRLQV